MQIEVKNLSYAYSASTKALTVHALKDISITVKEGEFLGIIGQTGSGKSTFVQHLNGLIKLGKNNGSIVVGEYDLSNKKCDFKSLRAKVGMVFQYPEYQLFAETVKDDVAFGLKKFFPKMEDSEVDKKVRQAIEIVGLDYDKIKNQSPFELSGGQKRRVAIAGVIVSRPEVLVLDEPVAGLDPVGKKEFISLLKKLHASFVKTIILVSHDMNLVSEHCSRVAVFSGGKIIKEGKPQDIFGGEDLGIEGLLQPATATLTNILHGAGIDIDSDLTIDGFTSAVANKLGGKR